MRTRKNVYTLTDQTLHWYGVAVDAMKARAPNDPRSWTYQAAIHGTSSPIPSGASSYWAQCQHATSFFLPWHRMYLLHFERIVAHHVAAAGGPPDWALPYWNYSDPALPARRELPPAFRSATVNGSPNPLYVAQRRPGMNAGTATLSTVDVDLWAALTAPSNTNVGGFFGSPTPGHSSTLFGMLEGRVHNNVHVGVGGWTGWMSDPDFAALDPIFWLHHANIDRLWEVWLGRDPAHQNLSAQFWLTGVAFDFHDATGTPVQMRTADVLKTTAPGIDYQYDDVSDPLAVPAPPVAAGVQPSGPGAAGGTGAMKSPGPNELAGATLSPVVLADQMRTVSVPTPVSPVEFRKSVAPHALVVPGPARQLVQQVTLHLEHVTSQNVAPVYDVYLNLPLAAASPAGHQDRFVGRAAMFGIKLASDPAGQHAGSGQSFAFDITDLYYRLEDAGDIDPRNLRVSFVPVEPGPGIQVHVGRISLYFG